MDIIVVAAELAPFAKAGGLADMVRALPVEWSKFGHRPVVFLPKYKSIDINYWGFKPTQLKLHVPMNYWTEYGMLWEGRIPGTDVPVYLIENNDYFNRDGIYGNPDEFEDNYRRFTFFSRAIFDAAFVLNIKPDIIHAHDYHTALATAFLKSHYIHEERFKYTAAVFTIHNLAYQGKFRPELILPLMNIPMDEYYPGSWFEHHGTVNLMKTGIMFADKITTVSPTYAEEIKTPYFGEGLHEVLKHRSADLIGILNGVYYEEWSPENDENLKIKYDIHNLASKRINKIYFLEERGVSKDDNPDIPLFGMVTRLAEQKGIDILMEILEPLLAEGKIRFALLGSGEQKYVDYFNYLAAKYPGRALIYIGYSTELSHKIIAASDFLLMPSRFEPCGLTQMYALRYGTIPVVHQVGGLADTVFEYNYEQKSGNGFTFYHYSGSDFNYAITRALGVYNNGEHWLQIRQNAMRAEYSSMRTAAEYLKTFGWALEKVRGFNGL